MSPKKEPSTKKSWAERPASTRDVAITFIVVGFFAIIGFGMVAFAVRSQPEPLRDVLVTFPAASLSGQQVAAGSGGPGQAVFEQNCVGCHTIGGGDMVGPDLQGVTEQRDTEWLTRWLLEPDKVLAEGDPIATELLQEFNNVPMINQGLSEAEVAAILAYLANPTGEAAPAQAATAQTTAAALEGNSTHGEALFTGATHLQNGAPACIGCHSTSDVGVLGGGVLGPDLTNVFNRYGETGLAVTLQSLPFPTMQGVYDNHPLTEDEIADLYAYFVREDQATAQSSDISFILFGLIGFVILLLISQFIWRKRVTEIRRPLLGEAQ